MLPETYRLTSDGATIAKASVMDIARPDIKRQKRRRQIVGAVIGVVVLALVTIGVSRLKPAAQQVERSTVWTDTGQRTWIPYSQPGVHPPDTGRDGSYRGSNSDVAGLAGEG